MGADRDPGALVANRVLWNNRFNMRCRPIPAFLVFLLLGAGGKASAQPPTDVAGADERAAAQAEAYRLFLRGRHLESADDIDGAIRSFRQASDIDQNTGEILAELSTLYARHNRGEEAVTAARESLERDPENQSAHRILGLIYAAPCQRPGWHRR